MGVVYADDGYIAESEIRQKTVQAIVDPLNQKLVGAHGDEIVHRA